MSDWYNIVDIVYQKAHSTRDQLAFEPGAL